jgi:hypothetical protein
MACALFFLIRLYRWINTDAFNASVLNAKRYVGRGVESEKPFVFIAHAVVIRIVSCL